MPPVWMSNSSPSRFDRHRGALEVPSGPSRSEIAFPGRLSLARALPEHEIAGVLFLVLFVVDPSPGEVRLGPDARQLAVLGEGRDAVVDRSVAAVGVARVFQALHELHHLRDVVGSSRVVFGPLDVQGVEVGKKRLDETVRVLANPETRGGGLADGLVVDVRQVHDLGDVVTEEFQGAPQNVLEEKGAEIADVGEVIDRRPAGVHPHVPRLDRLEIPRDAGSACCRSATVRPRDLRARDCTSTPMMRFQELELGSCRPHSGIDLRIGGMSDVRRSGRDKPLPYERKRAARNRSGRSPPLSPNGAIRIHWVAGGDSSFRRFAIRASTRADFRGCR